MLIELCQGYRKCNLIASDDTFYKNQTDNFYQTNCKKRKRLKVFYTCTNSKILTDDYQNRQHQIDSFQQNLTTSSDLLSSTTTPTMINDLNNLPSADESSSSEVSSSSSIEQTTRNIPNHFEIGYPFVPPKASREEGSSGEDDLENDPSNCTTVIAKKSALGFISEWIQAAYYVSGLFHILIPNKYCL